jgi:hypothetical protein
MGRRVDSICQHKALLDFVNFTALTGADEFDIALSAGIAPPAADEADNCGGYGLCS